MVRLYLVNQEKTTYRIQYVKSKLNQMQSLRYAFKNRKQCIKTCKIEQLLQLMQVSYVRTKSK